MTKGLNFNGIDVLKKQKEDGTDRVLVCFEMIQRGIPREKYNIFKDGKNIGFVTSGTYSPTLKKPIGMALINKIFKDVGNEIDIEIREKNYKAKIVKRPFYSYMGGK